MKRTLALIAATLFLMVGTAVAALAEPVHGLVISVDGQSFSPSAPPALFAAGIVLVPGSTAESTMWIRNDSGATANLTLELIGGEDSDVAESPFAPPTYDPVQAGLRVGASTGETVGDPVPVTPGRHQLLPTSEVRSAATVRLVIAVSLPADAPNTDQRRQQGFALRITLGSDVAVIDDSAGTPKPSDPSPGEPAPGQPTQPDGPELIDDLPHDNSRHAAAPAGSTGALSWTGFAVGDWLFVSGMLAVGGATVLLLFGRRRQDRPEI